MRLWSFWVQLVGTNRLPFSVFTYLTQWRSQRGPKYRVRVQFRKKYKIFKNEIMVVLGTVCRYASIAILHFTPFDTMMVRGSKVPGLSQTLKKMLQNFFFSFQSTVNNLEILSTDLNLELSLILSCIFVYFWHFLRTWSQNQNSPKWYRELLLWKDLKNFFLSIRLSPEALYIGEIRNLLLLIPTFHQFFAFFSK